MSSILTARHLKTTLLTLIVSVAIIGCSKKQETSAAIAPASSSDTNAQAATPVVSAANIPASTDVNQSLADADAALKAQQYDRAVQSLLAVQNQKQLTDQQAQEARTKMAALQHNLAAASAAGDPNAKAAGEILRRSAMHVK
jgi:hypothetical protein